MDCGAWMCLKFVAYMNAAFKKCLYEESLDGSSTVSFEFTGNINVQQWAVLARRHLLKSICSGSIDLDDEAVKSICARVKVPNCRNK